MLEYRLAQLTTLAGFLAIFVGATVHPTGSGMACPDWSPLIPICNGQVFPEMKGGVLFEHGHRFAAYGVGLSTVALAVALWLRRRRERAVRALGLLAVLAVLAQGTLGGVTVLLGLSKPVSIAHLALAMAFFGFLVLLTHHLSPSRAEAAGPVTPRLARWAAIAAALVYLQSVLGAVVRHSGAALQCLDLPLCGGELWPEGALRQVHMAHRFGAIVAGLVVLAVVVGAWRAGGRARALAVLVAASLAAQIALGVYSVLTFTSVPVVVAHLVVGALLLGLLLALSVTLSRRVRAAEKHAAEPRAGWAVA